MTLKILNYNIHKGRSFFLRHRTWDSLERLVNTVVPDIIFLQEFLKEPQSERLLEKFADKLWPHYSFGQNALMGDYHYGNAILSKFPFIETDSMDISTNNFERRGLLYGKIAPHSDKNLYLFCTHLDLTFNGRVQQIQKIRDITSHIIKDDDQVILAGDFNDWNQRLHHHVCEHMGCREVSESIHNVLLPTSPSIYPKFSLDRIYYRNITVKSSAILMSSGLRILSDHLPTVAEFEI